MNSVPNLKIALIITFSKIDALYEFNPFPAVLFIIHYYIYYAVSNLEFKCKVASLTSWNQCPKYLNYFTF